MNKMLYCFTLFSLSVSSLEETLIVTHKRSGVCMKWLCVVMMVWHKHSNEVGNKQWPCENPNNTTNQTLCNIKFSGIIGVEIKFECYGVLLRFNRYQIDANTFKSFKSLLTLSSTAISKSIVDEGLKHDGAKVSVL